MSNTREGRNKQNRIYRLKRILQIVLLFSSTSILGFLSFFYFQGKDADISNLEDGMSQPTVIYDYSGEEASKISASKNEGLRADQMPDSLKNAVVAIEDKRFYEHSGIDYKGIMRALFTNIKAGGVVEGGSTITQQLTKNALLTHEKTYKRKMEEFFLAREIDKKYSKEEILQMYLNQIYFGEGAWGVKNAALKYFGKDAEDLTISESAILAGIIKAPSALNPIGHPKEAVERRDTVLLQMKEQNYISASEYEQAKAEPLALNDKGGDPLKGKFPYYVDHVLDEAIELYGLTQDELLTEGYRIYTELDPDMQAAAEEIYQRDDLFPQGKEDQIVQSGAVLVDPESGGVRALVGGRGEHVFRGFNRATQLKRQPGSAMKPLAAYAPALEEGWKATDQVKDEKMTFGGYEPGNYNGQYRGQVPMYEAVKDSLNLPAVWILNEIGIEAGIEASKRFGIPLEESDRDLGIALGGLSSGVSPLEMAGAYAAFANNGVREEAHAIIKIEDAQGNVIAEREEKSVEAVSKEAAEQMTTMLLGVVEQGTGKAAGIPGRETAGKTGSTQVPIEGIDGVKDQWFTGYTPQLAGAVWVGYDHTDENHYLTTTSSEGAAPIFRELMEAALEGKEAESFNVPHISYYIEQKEKEERWKRAREWEENLRKEAEKWQEKLREEKGKWEDRFKGRDKEKEKEKEKKKDKKHED
ncbi:transglycosylase domain-containing protein [Bacillus infantis]|uniref:transglycosylase domain-containing protein n=1 Tax=Bacillus infantis TaxID=324767 RepID=UPI003CFB490B